MIEKMRKEADRVWGAANAAFFFKQEQDGCGGSAGVEVIAAALEKARNEAIDEMQERCRIPNERNSLGFLQQMTVRLHNEILENEAARLKGRA